MKWHCCLTSAVLLAECAKFELSAFAFKGITISISAAPDVFWIPKWPWKGAWHPRNSFFDFQVTIDAARKMKDYTDGFFRACREFFRGWDLVCWESSRPFLANQGPTVLPGSWAVAVSWTFFYSSVCVTLVSGHYSYHDDSFVAKFPDL